MEPLLHGRQPRLALLEGDPVADVLVELPVQALVHLRVNSIPQPGIIADSQCYPLVLKPAVSMLLTVEGPTGAQPHPAPDSNQSDQGQVRLSQLATHTPHSAQAREEAPAHASHRGLNGNQRVSDHTGSRRKGDFY
ncbi:hypothetical protein NHX12_000268 [Muraenolepis orangiensis]|uniref:Uncharacterized protein n=1 Tax=Muraenolepis orangiensis TaxID=630683 RepID=A0A9Q0I1R0_9TELE|nr:hypothetical protein NHX12_000268 [Muraenolepis orangiensis]